MKRPLAAVLDESPTSAEVFKQAKRVAQSPSARFANLRLPQPALQSAILESVSSQSAAGSPSRGSPKSNQRLPVFGHWKDIVETVEQNDVVLVAGDTGCGKTTGIPHILFKHHLKKYGRRVSIVVTQPRVVAATSLAKRVSDQFAKDRDIVSLLGPRVNLGLGGVVGYRVRFEDRISPKDTCVTFATDGLIIRECLYDVTKRRGSTSTDDSTEHAMTEPSSPKSCEGHSSSVKAGHKNKPYTAFQRYDYVIIDEAHERSLRVDELLGLARVALCSSQRRFKLIVMSATLDAKVFTDFFDSDKFKAGHITIPGRTFPVSLNYLKAPCSDYLDAALAAVCQIMITSDTGDILVFLPGADDIKSLCFQLENRIAELTAFTKLTNEIDNFLKVVEGSANIDLKAKLLSCHNLDSFKALLTSSAQLQTILNTNLTDEELTSLFQCLERAKYGYYFSIIVQYKLSDSISLPSKLDQSRWLSTQWTVLPLYSQLSYQDQLKVFLPPKHENHRKVIVATNIAETSITLPNIKFVVDSGKVKQKYLNTLKTVDISMAMGRQRSGRAGRVQEGIAFRLYTEDHYFDLQEQSLPEIARCDLAQLLLDLKTVDGRGRQFSSYLGVNKEEPFSINNFPLPTMPPAEAIEDAERLLFQLGALEGPCRLISKRGLQLSALPLPVIWANLVLEAIERKCLMEIITIAAMAALDEEWFPQFGDGLVDVGAKRKRLLFPDSDHLGLMNLFNCWQQATDKSQFCRMLGIEDKTLHKAKLIRDQLKSVLLHSDAFNLSDISSVLQGAETKEALNAAHEQIRECLAYGLYTNIAVRRDDWKVTNNQTTTSDPSAAVYMNLFDKEKIVIHPSSAFYIFKHKRPECIVYSSLIETQQKYARDVSAINTEWIIKIQAMKNHDVSFHNHTDQMMSRNQLSY